MAIPLKQSTASQEILIGPFLDDTDGKTQKTGLTIANTDIKIWVNGGTSEASKNSGGATHIAAGRYYCVLDATDTATLGPMEINIHVSGALPVRRECLVLAANVYDSLIGGGDILDVSVTQWTGTNVASPDTAGYPKVTVKSGTGTGEVSLSSGLVRLSATGVDDIWDEATAGHATAGTTGKALTDAGGAGTPPTAAVIADAVWDEILSGHAVSGSTGAALSSAGAAGSPPSAGTIADAVWDEARSGHVASGSFGESVVLSASERNAAADALLNRATSSITESAAPKKSLYAAIAKLTHKVDSAAGTLTVKRSDDTTTHFTQTEVTDAAADPLTGLGGAA